MSDYADSIVNEAMGHSFVLDDDGKPKKIFVAGGIVFGRCTEGCSVSMGSGTNEPVPADVAEAEIRHRLYVAVTQTTEHLMHLPAAESVPLALQTVPGIAPGTEPAAKAGDPCPTCGAAMVQMQGGVECISDHK